MKAMRGGKAPLILNFTTQLLELSVMSRPLYPPETESPYPLNRSLHGPKKLSRHFWRRENSLVPVGIWIPLVQYKAWSLYWPCHHSSTNFGWKEKNESYYNSTVCHFMYEIFFSDEFSKCWNNSQLQYRCETVIKNPMKFSQVLSGMNINKTNRVSDTSCDSILMMLLMVTEHASKTMFFKLTLTELITHKSKHVITLL